MILKYQLIFMNLGLIYDVKVENKDTAKIIMT